MKRFLGCCLIVTMFMSIMTAFARENDYAGTKYEIPSKVLNAFDIISFHEDGNLDVGSKVSRAEFTVMVTKALVKDLDGVRGVDAYTDIEVGTQLYNAVAFAKELGLLSGYEDGTFRPGEAISVAQAASILSKMIGYKTVAEAKGGYPFGYMQVARETGILDGVSYTSGSLSKADAILMLYNAMHADMMKQVHFGDTQKYQVQKGVNLFSEYHGVYRTSGIITDNGITALTGESRIAKNQVEIDGVVYEQNDPFLADALGYVVEVYYTDQDEREIVFGYVLEEKNGQLQIDADDLQLTGNSLKDGYFSYRDNQDKVQRIYVSKGFDVIYNGRAYPQFVLEDLLIQSGTLCFVDNNRDGEYEVLFVEAFEHLVVSGSDQAARKIFSFDNRTFEIDQDAEYDFITTSGERLDIGDLTTDATVSIFESVDKTYVKGIVSTKKVTGAIDEIIFAESAELVMGGARYQVSKAYEQFDASSVKVGSVASIHLDHKGEIAFLNPNPTSQQAEYLYGYFINGEADKGLSTGGVFRVFTHKGVFVNYHGAAHMTLNGKTTNPEGKRYTAGLVLESPLISSAGKVKHQLIRYKLNASDEIMEIETAVANTSPLGFDQEVFSMDYSANAVYRDIPKMFGSSYIVNNDTLLFNIPKEKDGKIDEDACMMLSLSQFEGNTLYPITLYDSNASRISSVLVTSYFSAEEYSKWGLLVEKVTTNLNDDGEIVTKVYGYLNGKKDAYEFSSGKTVDKPIKTGDLLRVMLNVKNQIVDYAHLFQYETDVFPSKMSSNPGGVLVGVYGKVLSKEKGAMTVVVEGENVYPFVFSTYTRVYSVDRSNTNNIMVGLATSDEIIQSGKNYSSININNMVGSKVFINRRYDNAYDVIIIKD